MAAAESHILLLLYNICCNLILPDKIGVINVLPISSHNFVYFIDLSRLQSNLYQHAVYQIRYHNLLTIFPHYFIAKLAKFSKLERMKIGRSMRLMQYFLVIMTFIHLNRSGTCLKALLVKTG